MDPSNLKAINDLKADKLLTDNRHQELITSQTQVQNTILSAVTSLIKYLEGQTTKTQVVNQLKSINTPDAFRVVQAVDSLHETLKTHENTDLSEVTKVMTSILEEAKKIPKELPKEKEEQDYTTQFKSLVEAVKSVEKVVKEQDLIVHPPVVNVPETKVNVEALDLKPLQKSIRDVVTAIKKIVIPTYKTDNKAVEKLLKDSNKLLKGILDKPVSSGGGGGRATPYQDSNGIPAFVTLNSGAIPVTSQSSIYKTEVDKSTTTDVIYIGKAPIGTATSTAGWQIKKIDKTVTDNITITFAASGAFTAMWNNRGSEVYS